MLDMKRTEIRITQWVGGEDYTMTREDLRAILAESPLRTARKGYAQAGERNYTLANGTAITIWVK